MSPRRRKILKVTAYSLGGLVLFLGILLIAFRIALARAPNYRAQVEAWVSERTNLSIEFSELDARMRYYGPELVFDSAVVRSKDRKRTLVRAKRVSIGFDVWTAIGTGRLAAGRITLEQPELQIVRTVDGRIEVVGQHELPERDPNEESAPDDLPTGRLLVRDAQVGVRDLKTGRGPWIIPNVSFDLQRSGRAMHIDGEAALPASLGKSLQFKADTAGKLADAAELEWQFNIDARAFDLAGWAQVMPKDWPAPRKGRGSFQVSGALRGARPNELAMHVDFDRVALVLPNWQEPMPAIPTLEIHPANDSTAESVDSDATLEQTDEGKSEEVADRSDVVKDGAAEKADAPTSAEYSRVAFDLHLQHAATPVEESWHVSLDNLELSRSNQEWRSKAIALTATTTTAGSINVEGSADNVLLDNVWPLLAYASESPAGAMVRAMDAKGVARELRIRATRADDSSPMKFNLSGRFENLATAAVAKLPGIEHFAGAFIASESGGQVNLNVRDGAFALPRIFRTPLPIDRIEGRVSWQHESDGWRIAAENLAIDCPDGHADASGTVLVPADGGSPIVDLKAQGTNLDARAAPRYMPAGKLSPAALAWLDRAFVAGKVPRAEFQMRGPSRSFPFRDGTGLFLIQAHIEGLTLDYQPAWIPATGLTVDAEFRNEGMSARLLQGEVNGLRLKSGFGRIADFKRAELSLDVDATGDLADALPYLQKSPVGPGIGSQFMLLSGQGALQAQARIILPFKEVERRKLAVTARLSDATIALEGLKEQATRVAGTLVIQDFALKSLSMQGAFMGGSVAVTGGAENRYYGRGAGMQLSAKGSARGSELANLLHLPRSVPLSGSTQWVLQAKQERHAPDAPAPRSVVIESDVRGLGIAMPEPVGKGADLARALRVDIEAPDDAQVLLRGAFGEIRALVRLSKNENGWRVERGGFRFDSQAAALPAHEGFRIEGDIDRVVLDDWLRIKGDGSGKSKVSDFLRAANVRVKEFLYLGYQWNDVRTLLQAADSAWRVDVAGQDIAGQLTIPYVLETGDPLRIALNKLNVGDHQSRGDASAADPHDVPAITGRIDQFSLSGRNVGSARFQLDKNAQGVQLKSGELRGDSFTVTAQGSWTGTAASSNSALTLDLASTDVRETLRAFNFNDVITGKRANAHAALTWPGSIDENLLARSSGKVGIEITDGQLLKVEPGAGRMLGLMSIAALPRRLSLDFSDVTDKGFSFDTVRGDFYLEKGDAYTDNLLVRGPAGETGIAGRTRVGKRDYDLTAVVAGDIGGSLSVASTAVGGPVIGAAVLAFTRLFKEPLKGVTRRYYRIVGSWDNPTVERIDKQEAKQDAAQAVQETLESERQVDEAEDKK
jgi:uncharacterized protein (TIGR02099 family)